MSPWQAHVEKWLNCKRCNLQHCRENVVLGRGRIPADILLIGEAPGESEDVLAQPFVGPAGKLLDHIVEEGVPSEYSCCFTNIVACIPRDEEWHKVSKPHAVELQACLPRLKEIVAICKPKLVVLVGVEAQKWIRANLSQLGLVEAQLVDLIHPAAILRATPAAQGIEVKRCKVKLLTAIRALEERHNSPAM